MTAETRVPVRGPQYLIAPEPRPTSDVPYHHDRAPGQKYLLVDGDRLPGSPLYLALRRIDTVPADQPRWLDPHRHNCNSFYVFIGDGPALTGLEAMVTLADSTVAVGSPAAVLVPPRMLHSYWLTSGSGWYLQITLCATYAASLLPDDDESSDTAPSIADPIQTAVQTEHGWRFVDSQLFPEPGVRIAVNEIRTGDSTTGEASRPDPGSMSIGVLLARENAAARARLTGANGSVEVTAPATSIALGSAHSFSAIEDALVVWIAPDAAFGSNHEVTAAP